MLYIIVKRSKIAPLCISVETVEVGFFVTGFETHQIIGVEMSTGGSTQSNVKSFLTIYLSVNSYTEYLIIKLSKFKKAKKLITFEKVVLNSQIIME
jgi:hypothetical protein